MKKQWTKPIMECEQFVANEYAAACDKYILKCSFGVDSTGAERTPRSFLGPNDTQAAFMYTDANGNYLGEFGTMSFDEDLDSHGCGTEYLFPIDTEKSSIYYVSNGTSSAMILEGITYLGVKATGEPYREVQEFVIWGSPNGDGEFCVSPGTLSSQPKNVS